MPRRVWLVPGLGLLLLGASVAAQPSAVQRPADGEFVRDLAGLLTPGELRQVNQRCEQLLADTGVPVFVLSVERLSAYGDGDASIETFARAVFERWGQEHPLVRGHEWRRGVLFVVALRDRQTRIELGREFSGGAGGYDRQMRDVIDQFVLPSFRGGDYAAGVAGGVGGIDMVVRTQPLPRYGVSRRAWFWSAVAVGLSVFTTVSLLRRGRHGWAWVFWGVIFGALGAMLLSATRKPSSGGWSIGGGTGGGSLGGSFGGGGGASGGW
ncbi:MAG: TPM domain-containing protein [Planctomycetota bacterium]